ncbi:MAG: fluoride efflux transporter CrcB [Burkholderiaceae bacterium]
MTAAGFAAVAIGATLGAWLRWGLAVWLNAVHPVMPLGTWIANLLGGLLIGAVLGVIARVPELDPLWRLFLVTGFLGGLTTFSTFSAESLLMLQRGDFGWALVHTGAHLFGALLAAALGWRLVAPVG